MSCPVCGVERGEHLLSKPGDESELRLSRCHACGVVYQEDAPRTFVDEDYEYYAAEHGREMDDVYDPINRKRYESILRDLELVAPGRRLLDYGCGRGQFVHDSRELGWDAFGADLSESAVALCRKFGVSAARVDIDQLAEDGNIYDVISLFEVIEHLPDPQATVRSVARCLAPDGILYMTTPNFQSLDRRILGRDWRVIHREHVTYFTPRSLRALVAGAGFEILRLATSGVSPEILLRRTSASGGDRAAEQDVRTRVEASRLLSLAKAMINKALHLTGWGATMTLVARKRD